MKALLILVLPWSFIGAGVYALVQRTLRSRREGQEREVLRRRVNREIDHPASWGDDAA